MHLVEFLLYKTSDGTWSTGDFVLKKRTSNDPVESCLIFDFFVSNTPTVPGFWTCVKTFESLKKNSAC